MKEEKQKQPNERLRRERELRGWSQKTIAEKLATTESLVSQWESGKHRPNRHFQTQLCKLFEKNAEELGFLTSDESSDLAIMNATTGSQKGVWSDDLLKVYTQGIAACQDLFFNGSPYHVEAILPLYCSQTMNLAQYPSPVQKPAARLAALCQLLMCELLTDREDFGAAVHASKEARKYGQIADDIDIQVASFIGLANIGFHRKLSTAALSSYQHAISLFNDQVTPLLKGRTYAGIAEVYAMRGQLQEAMRAMGLAYEHFPARPQDDPAYTYLRSSRYSLYVFGDAQSRLFLGQPKEAEKALIAAEQETPDIQAEPITKLDMLYYQADVQIQQRNIEKSCVILADAAILAKELGSRLYFNKLAVSYHNLMIQSPEEPMIRALEDIYQPW